MSDTVTVRLADSEMAAPSEGFARVRAMTVIRPGSAELTRWFAVREDGTCSANLPGTNEWVEAEAAADAARLLMGLDPLRSYLTWQTEQADEQARLERKKATAAKAAKTRAANKTKETGD